MAEKAKRELRRLEVEPAENGGFTITHYFKDVSVPTRRGLSEATRYVEPEKHVFGPGDDLKVTAHVSKALGLKDAPEEGAEAESGKTMVKGAAAKFAAGVKRRMASAAEDE